MRIFKITKGNTKSEKISGELLQLKNELQKKLTMGSNADLSLNATERLLIEEITRMTHELNINNITRTKAYLDFYKKHSDIHWAFLGHLVSRNGGWNMTDLKGEFLSKLLTEDEQEKFFIFLERGNWLIFQDVFPQLLLYETSLELKEPLFHLLPCFSVSTFMDSVWNFFWRTGNRRLLTVSLIINEQSYLEKQLMINDQQNQILKTIEFSLQDVLSLNHILFPYDQTGETKLTGQTLHHFTSLPERIELGKRMYALLYSNQKRYERSFQWAQRNPHTGSRTDYWPGLFKRVKETIPGRLYNPQVKNCKLKSGAAHLYSPELQFAWKDIVHNAPVQADWFNNVDVVDYLIENPKSVDGEIQHAYCKSLEKLAFTTFAKKAIFLRKG
ncbi:DUF2515 domain-containing protein [Bacillus sp. Marseille-Q3570]|uniref:DUF2515 domain-containing protein n=1 Tax=Bacillus sp. Marseille-Q3570 TaxID=2963522 RepID=UPI0021B76E7E|nr:DUF2515 domain-containing protein [Bacillus sp. Marseille-Q3570]